MNHSGVRPDIQFLRGIAILVVLIYHSGLIPLAGGYIGVDVFFVISGYLITSIIIRDLAVGRFSFTHFYARRAKRLLPAAYCTLILTTFFGAQMLGPSQWDDFIEQLVGTVTFTANIVLPFQSGYFETAAENKPLLHAWSLSVEEQYYLLIPLALYLIPQRWHFRALALIAFLSLGICITFVSFPFVYWRLPGITSPSAAFFFLPTRAWEMLAGSLLAWLMLKSPALNLPNAVKKLALLLIAYLCVFPIESIHPRENAVLVVLATAILLTGNGAWLAQNLVTRAVEKIGDWSYSLYLVHWPLFVLTNTAYLGETPQSIKVILVFAAILLAYLQYEYVEQRFRYGWQVNRKKTFKWLAAASLLVVFTPISADIIRSWAHDPSASILQAPNRGFNEACSSGKLVFEIPMACSSASQPAYALWGDSYAMHLVPGLLREKPIADSLIQITKAACAPILGVASLDNNYNEDWAKECLAFNDKAIRYIENNPSIRYVIMSSPFSGYFDEGELRLYYQGKKIVGDRTVAIEQMLVTLNRLVAHGKVPLLVAPPPRPGFDIGECWQHLQYGLLVLGRKDCNFRYEEHQAYQRDIIDSLSVVQRRSNVRLARFDNILCKDDHCETSLTNGISIYKDSGHLSGPGSEWAVPQLGLTRRLEASQAASNPARTALE